MNDLFVTKIVEDATGRVVWRSKPTDRRNADKMADGAGRNLDWGKFSVIIEEVPVLTESTIVETHKGAD